jgi:hypothetical protein
MRIRDNAQLTPYGPLSRKRAFVGFSSESAPRPSWESRTGRNNLLGGLAIRRAAGPSDQTNSPHPSSRQGTSFHRWVELKYSPIAIDPVRLSCRCNVPGPTELGAVNPDAVQDRGEPACQRHHRLFHSTTPRDLHRPGLNKLLRRPSPSIMICAALCATSPQDRDGGRSDRRRPRRGPRRRGLAHRRTQDIGGEEILYCGHATTRKSLGLMIWKLSVTESQWSAQFRGTVSRKNPSVASANWAQVA